jgi:hypothetical protein
MVQRHLPTPTAAQPQHPLFRDIVAVATHLLDLELAEKLGESNALIKYQARLAEQNATHAKKLAAMDDKHAGDIKLRSDDHDLRIPKLT